MAGRASMRPRVFPAEDTRERGRSTGRSPCASMRPRVFPAEDRSACRRRRTPTRRFNEAAGIPRGRHHDRRLERRRNPAASMRPRVFPAEDLGYGRPLPRGNGRASMRPRVFPAEDPVSDDRGHSHSITLQ